MPLVSSAPPTSYSSWPLLLPRRAAALLAPCSPRRLPINLHAFYAFASWDLSWVRFRMMISGLGVTGPCAGCCTALGVIALPGTTPRTPPRTKRESR